MTKKGTKLKWKKKDRKIRKETTIQKRKERDRKEKEKDKKAKSKSNESAMKRRSAPAPKNKEEKEGEVSKKKEVKKGSVPSGGSGGYAKGILVGMFFMSGAIYLYQCITHPRGTPEASLSTAAFKTFPMLLLFLYSLASHLQNQSLPDQPPRFRSRASTYFYLVLLGLFFSSLGDLSLVFSSDPSYFFLGIFFFLVAHLLYILAFGLPFLSPFPVCPGYALLLYGFGFLVYYFMLLPELPSNLAGAVETYVGVICTMGWRAAARLCRQSSLSTFPGSRVQEHNMSLSVRSAVAGALLFLASDLILSFNRFVYPFHIGPFLTMLTYYIAQFGIAASVHCPP